jgi:hypothetical protein
MRGYVTLSTYGTVSFSSDGISAISEAFHITDRRRRTDGRRAVHRGTARRGNAWRDL